MTISYKIEVFLIGTKLFLEVTYDVLLVFCGLFFFLQA